MAQEITKSRRALGRKKGFHMTITHDKNPINISHKDLSKSLDRYLHLAPEEQSCWQGFGVS